MDNPTASDRLGLSVPYEWWPAASLLKEIEAAGFGAVQIPSPPPSVLVSPRQASRHAKALDDALETSRLDPVIHAPGGTRLTDAEGAAAMQGLISYAADIGASVVVYHALNFPDAPASEDLVLAETRALARLAPLAERLGVTIALENLAPVFPGPEALSFTPFALRAIAKRVGSPAIALCVDVGHANVVASLRRADPLDLIEPVIDLAAVVHLHDNLGARRGNEPAPELDPLRLDLHLPPGRGTVPWGRLAPLLRRVEAPLLLEVHPPRPAASELFALAREALGEAERIAVQT
jgi:sugar phosphate isomerase/epimerase